ncbi:MAG: hypothetical protein E5299_00691 [Burkholderia gladioli]|nr:MAG: hypothetical protein E5299_00691 [Burkholderia gladioli]
MEIDGVGTPGGRVHNKGLGDGFRTVLDLPTASTELPSTCRMTRPHQAFAEVMALAGVGKGWPGKRVML